MFKLFQEIEESKFIRNMRGCTIYILTQKWDLAEVTQAATTYVS